MTVLARWCFRHRFVVLGIWVVLLTAIAVPYAKLGTSYSDAFSLPDRARPSTGVLIPSQHDPSTVGMSRGDDR
ncbi:hypothetical protein [Streptomyces sp. NPDC046197]|uniref:hypothetical protein n=1 Tax=Streptomyces sp. NPDC046197 TaxID=3154337 RepID=UPI0033EFE0A5